MLSLADHLEPGRYPVSGFPVEQQHVTFRRYSADGGEGVGQAGPGDVAGLLGVSGGLSRVLTARRPVFGNDDDGAGDEISHGAGIGR